VAEGVVEAVAGRARVPGLVRLRVVAIGKDAITEGETAHFARSFYL
jgi:hypothetical protein